uniref:3-deoxy-7-phosphoheptulonate synthase n=1 Tax=Chromera velia CCMP2878 TaxID=1169474 RepID=A0A0G4H956_9ALVE|eukprot:Cvel_25221.t1-p1 / transcript=Cvel_25221.t1 / gene=Cvel_25221 / organism=Chromera_velia_CCMP2878 / gene_product=Phospho-2-dehydro-3-deoxyheptonate aldolase,, putative / transcript_product=Phospho-2-dehydro-3-deoxyheptonate aldolase,, putative / location=Cvel_scaffold2828:692-1528(-) / protein_length=279 / sequence_SO=supercontig / SO=protein_coding / is_pseudo=false
MHAGSHFQEHFSDQDLDNQRIEKIQAVIQPQLLMEEVPVTAAAKHTVLSARAEMSRVLRGDSNKIALIVGPCSIHDPEGAIEYARKLRDEAERCKEDVLILMRVYFEKPRTAVGWKGLINDPDLDETFQINKGLRLARRLLVDINNMGLPVACEFLDTLVPQYIADLVAWGAIGARTTESQLHRELSSGLSMPVGFKNGTDGNVQIAVDACRAASAKQRFLSITKQGIPAIVHSMGNPDVHVILRGGQGGPNFDEKSVTAAVERLVKAKVNFVSFFLAL